jgi:AAA+ superfamily predicted ATPase
MGLLRTAGSYLSALSIGDYQIPNPLAAVVNYSIDSYFAKKDERARIAEANRKEMPMDLDVYIKEVWLGCEIHKAINLSGSYPAYAKAVNAWAFTRMFTSYAGPNAAYEIVPVLDQSEYKDYLKSNREYRIQYESINISLTQAVSLPVYGTFFVKSRRTGAHLIVAFDFCYYGMGCSISVMAHSHGQHEAEAFLADVTASMQANNIYFKSCLSFNRGYLDFHYVIPTTWQQVILKDNLRTQIQKNSVGVLDHISDLSSIGMSANQSMLLISPPGMAKTTMFRATSNEINDQATRIWCTGKSILYPEHVTSLFEAARDLSPSVIFIEDMDLFGGDRSTLGRDSSVLNEFLAQLDGTQSNAGVVIMASTNDLDSMDEALINRPGRFGVKIEIPYPDKEDRKKMLVSFFKAYHARPASSVTDEGWNTIINLTAGFTGDYIREVAKTAVIKAVAEGRCLNGAVSFTIDDLTAAGEQVLQNYRIGKRAKKHHTISIEDGAESVEAVVASEGPKEPSMKLVS